MRADRISTDGMVRNMIRVALCQANLPVGDIDGNVERVRDRIGAANKRGADLVIFPELSISGYPPEDLLLKPSFAERARVAVHALAADVEDLVVLVGFPFLSGDLYNAAAVLADGKVAATARSCSISVVPASVLRCARTCGTQGALGSGQPSRAEPSSSSTCPRHPITA